MKSNPLHISSCSSAVQTRDIQNFLFATLFAASTAATRSCSTQTIHAALSRYCQLPRLNICARASRMPTRRRRGPKRQPHTTTPAPQSRLLGLPKELRIMIYEFDFASADATIRPFARTTPSLLQVNWHLAAEAIEFYYKHSQFSDELDGEKSGLSHFISEIRRERLGQIRHFAINCRLSVAFQDQEQDPHVLQPDFQQHYKLLISISKARKSCAKQIADLVTAGVKPSTLTITYPDVVRDAPSFWRTKSKMSERLQQQVRACLRSKGQPMDGMSAITWIRYR